nr:Chain A, brinker CG9653-PA [Drosophila melanogaster]
GSRRIFTPHFKLQVLESYRNDNDCKGNQRATARKYNIHRRQIQKWLQCESNLRSSVANN